MTGLCRSCLFARLFRSILPAVLLSLFIFSVSFTQGAGNALSFDGTDDYVAISQNNVLPIYNNNAYTIEFWIKGPAHDNGSIYSETHDGTTNENRLTIFKIGSGLASESASDKFDFYFRTGNGSSPGHFYSNGVVFDDYWHHIAFVDNNGSATLYIDGIVDRTFSYTKPTLTLNTSSIGAARSNPTLIPGIRSFFQGNVDEFRVWNSVRTQDEIRDNMCIKLLGNESNLVVYYRFDDSSGNVLSDVTSNSNDGLIFGTFGRATSGGTNTLTNTNAAWTIDEWANETLFITGGTGSGQSRLISSNTSTVITVSPDWTTIPDNSSTYSITNADAWEVSGASVGDVSTYLYPISWLNQTISLNHPDGDNITVSEVTGTVDPNGIQIYRVDEAPNVTTPPTSYYRIDPLRYWGVFIIGGTDQSFAIEYNYDGHPGIANEEDLRLARRINNADDNWTDLGITPNTDNHTLTANSQSGQSFEYVLGTISSDNSLPVHLAAFSAHQLDDGVQLEWITYSEINNQGFEIWRSTDNIENFEVIGSYQNSPELVGAGNSNATRQYRYVDKYISSGHIYYYQLWDFSYTGERKSYGPLSVTMEESESLVKNFVLYQNYPNPFNPATSIRFQIYSGGEIFPIRLEIYNLLGKKIKTLVNDNLTTGDYNFLWDGKDDEGLRTSSGVYLYVLKVGDQKASRKLIILD